MAWCPICKDEFRDGFDFCSRCNCSLVKELPGEEKVNGSEDELSRVEDENRNIGNEIYLLNVRDDNEASVVEAILRSNGIKAIRKYRDAGGYLNVYMGNSFSGIDIFVSSSEYDDAKELIEAEMEVETNEYYNETDEEKEASQNEESVQHRKRMIRAWIILLFFMPGFAGILVLLFIVLESHLFK